MRPQPLPPKGVGCYVEALVNENGQVVENAFQTDAAKQGALRKVACEFCGQEVRPVNMKRHHRIHFVLRFNARGQITNGADVLPYYEKLLDNKLAEVTKVSDELHLLREVVGWIKREPAAKT